MGREVRKVPADWEHPKTESGDYIPLSEGYAEAAKEFMELANKEGLQRAVDYFGGAPDQNDFMPDWEEHEKTHFQMYEDTTEGTPISPPMQTEEDLARWLADNKASAFGGHTATYEQWLNTIRAGWAPSMVMRNGHLQNGVEASKKI